MTRTFTFDSRLQLGNTITIDGDTTSLAKNEPMLFSCDLATSRKSGGPLTNKFLDGLSEEFLNSPDLIIDSRVHMLMPNFWPCIPGWHHDDVPRSTGNGQPNYINPEYHAKHCMMLVNGDVAPTEFAIGNSSFSDIKDGEKYYKVWHPEVDKRIQNGELISVDAPSNTYLYFDANTWHRGTKAVKFGWRWFIRATINTHRKPLNELRAQVQVYCSFEEEGW